MKSISKKSYIGIIVESPSKCVKIEKYLGEKYKCISSYGHLREIQMLKDINMVNFKIKYSIIAIVVVTGRLSSFNGIVLWKHKTNSL